MKRRSFIMTGLLALIPTISIAKNVVENKQKTIQEDQEEFYKFFEEFNGFKINEHQKMLYVWYKNDYGVIHMPRQTGCSIFLLTLAGFLNFKGKSVLYMTRYAKLAAMRQDYLSARVERYKCKFGWLNEHSLNGKIYDVVLMDANGYHKEMYDMFESCTCSKKFMLTTTELHEEITFPSLVKTKFVP